MAIENGYFHQKVDRLSPYHHRKNCLTWGVQFFQTIVADILGIWLVHIEGKILVYFITSIARV